MRSYGIMKRINTSLLLGILLSVFCVAQDKSILHINSYHPGLGWADNITQGIVSQLNEEIGVVVEYMDTKRNPSVENLHLLKQLYALRYKNKTFDAITCSDDNAFQFLLSYGDSLFSHTPIVFCGVNFFNDSLLRGKENITGVCESVDFKRNIDLIVQLHPKAQRLFFINGFSTGGKQNRALLSTLIDPYRELISIHFLDTLPEVTEETLISGLAKCGKNDVIYYSDFFLDSKEQFVDYETFIPRLTENVAAPVYAHSDLYLGLGIAGGYFVSSVAQGKAAGKMVKQILNGTPVKELPVVKESPNKYIFDYGQLQRFGIDISQLPVPHLLKNQPPHFFQKYRLVFVGIFMFIVLQAAVIIALLHISQLKKISEKKLVSAKEDLEILVEARTKKLRRALNDLRIETQDKEQRVKVAKQQEAFIEDVFASIQDGVSVLDKNLTIMRVNPKMEQWYANAMPLIGKKCFEAYHFNEEPCRHCPSIRAMKTMKPASRVVQGPPDHSDSWVEVFSYPLIDRESHELTGVVEFVRDITEKKNLEQKRVDMESRLRQNEKMEALGQLAGGIAHDFNNQLTGILGCAEMLTEELRGQTQLADLAQTIAGISKQTSQLTHQLLAFARKGTLVMQELDVNQSIADVIVLLHHSIHKNIRIEKQLDAEKHCIRGDASQVQNAILNIALNARDAMPEGGVLSFRTYNKTYNSHECRQFQLPVSPGEYLVLRIHDTGQGMTEEVKKRIFEPFYTTKEEGKGTGMGMAAVWGTVQAHRGAIQVHSDIGKGSEFILALPLFFDTEKKEVNAGNRRDATNSYRILIVDDEESVANTMRLMTKSLGHVAEMFTSSKKALAFYEKEYKQIDVVIIDMIMPEMGGEQLFERVKKIDPRARVIIVSGFSFNDSVQYLLDNGAAIFLKKPFTKKQFDETISQVVDAKKNKG